MEPEEKHAFISYVRENNAEVDRLCRVLEVAGIPCWRDRSALGPGDAWKAKIRDAIRSGAMVFLACFSEESRARQRSYMNEELTIAVEEFRLRPPGQTWLIPVRFDAGDVPVWDLGAGRTLTDLNYADLFGEEYTEHAVQLVEAIKSAMGTPGFEPATVLAAVEQVADADRPALLRRLTKDMVLDDTRQIELDDLIGQEVSRVLAAMHDPQRFPKELNPGTGDEQLLQLAALATDYWRLVEPFCWSLSIAARWSAPYAALAPWAKGIQAFCGEALKFRNRPNDRK